MRLNQKGLASGAQPNQEVGGTGRVTRSMGLVRVDLSLAALHRHRHPAVPRRSGIIYAAGVTALHDEVKWWLAWPVAGAGIICADMVLYGIGRVWGRRLFDYRWVQRLVKPDAGSGSRTSSAATASRSCSPPGCCRRCGTGIFIVAGAVRFPFSALPAR